MTEVDPFKFQAKLERVVDGDTQDLTVDLGFRITRGQFRIRLDDVDTAEVFGVAKESDEYERGQEHSSFVVSWYNEAESSWDGEWPLILDTKREDNKGKYGRWIGDVIRKSDGASLVEDLKNEFDDV